MVGAASAFRSSHLSPATSAPEADKPFVLRTWLYRFVEEGGYAIATDHQPADHLTTAPVEKLQWCAPCWRIELDSIRKLHGRDYASDRSSSWPIATWVSTSAS